MKAEKDKKTGKWLIQYRYTDWRLEGKPQKIYKTWLFYEKRNRRMVKKFFNVTAS